MAPSLLDNNENINSEKGNERICFNVHTDVDDRNSIGAVKANLQADPEVESISSDDIFEQIETASLTGLDDQWNPSTPGYKLQKGDSSFVNEKVKRKGSLSDVSEHSNFFIDTKKARTDVSPKNNSTEYFTVGDSGRLNPMTFKINNRSIVFSGGLPMQYVPSSNYFERLLGQTHLLGSGLTSSDTFANLRYATSHEDPNVMSQKSWIPASTAIGVQNASLTYVVNQVKVIHPTVQLAYPPMGNNATGNIVSNANNASQNPNRWVRWTEEEDNILRTAVSTVGEKNFKTISQMYFRGSRTELQCKNRWKEVLQPGLVKGSWTKEEDEVIKKCVESGNIKWSKIAKMLPGRSGKQVKERWMTTLYPNAKSGVWSEDEMSILIAAQKELGNKWSEIAKRLPGRSEFAVKNRWHNRIYSGIRSEIRAEKKAERIERRAEITAETKAERESEHHDREESEHVESELAPTLTSNDILEKSHVEDYV